MTLICVVITKYIKNRIFLPLWDINEVCCVSLEVKLALCNLRVVAPQLAMQAEPIEVLWSLLVFGWTKRQKETHQMCPENQIVYTL